VNKIPIEVQEGHGLEETAVLAEQLHSVQRICPIFIVSSVTKQGMKEMVHFIGRLKNRDDQIRVFKSENDPFEFDIHEHFMVDGVGIVVSGVVKGGRAVLNQVVHLGPDKNRQFKSVVIRSIHVNRASVKEVGVGKFATFGIKPHRAGEKILRTDFRKGMVMLAVDSDPQCVYEFEANINVLHHASTI
jgi:elongation factor 1-alpha